MYDLCQGDCAKSKLIVTEVAASRSFSSPNFRKALASSNNRLTPSWSLFFMRRFCVVAVGSTILLQIPCIYWGSLRCTVSLGIPVNKKSQTLAFMEPADTHQIITHKCHIKRWRVRREIYYTWIKGCIMGPWCWLTVGLQGMSGGGKLPCGRPVPDVCTPKTSPTNNFPRTHLKANSHVAPYCNRKAILPLRNPCKSMKVLTLRAESPHLKTRLLSLRPWTDGGHTFNPIWEKAVSEPESLLVLVYGLQVQRSEEINQPKTTRPFSSGTSLHPSR